jgi:hypothetical protein
MSFLLRMFFGGSSEEDPVIPPAGSSTGTDPMQCVKSSFDRGRAAIHCADQGAASGDNGTALDWQQAWKTSYSSGAIKIVRVSGGSEATGLKLDAGQCIKKAFDPTKGAFRVVTGLASKAGSSKMDPGQIFKHIFDQANNALRVETYEATESLGTILSWGQCIKKAFNATTGKLRISEDA